MLQTSWSKGGWGGWGNVIKIIESWWSILLHVFYKVSLFIHYPIRLGEQLKPTGAHCFCKCTSWINLPPLYPWWIRFSDKGSLTCLRACFFFFLFHIKGLYAPRQRKKNTLRFIFMCYYCLTVTHGWSVQCTILKGKAGWYSPPWYAAFKLPNLHTVLLAWHFVQNLML